MCTPDHRRRGTGDLPWFPGGPARRILSPEMGAAPGQPVPGSQMKARWTHRRTSRAFAGRRHAAPRAGRTEGHHRLRQAGAAASREPKPACPPGRAAWTIQRSSVSCGSRRPLLFVRGRTAWPAHHTVRSASVSMKFLAIGESVNSLRAGRPDAKRADHKRFTMTRRDGSVFVSLSTITSFPAAAENPEDQQGRDFRLSDGRRNVSHRRSPGQSEKIEKLGISPVFGRFPHTVFCIQNGGGAGIGRPRAAKGGTMDTPPDFHHLRRTNGPGFPTPSVRRRLQRGAGGAATPRASRLHEPSGRSQDAPTIFCRAKLRPARRDSNRALFSRGSADVGGKQEGRK